MVTHFLSREEAKQRIDEYKILLKYIPFLQKNGLTDCGRGQILGQLSILEEILGDNTSSIPISDSQSDSKLDYNNIDKLNDKYTNNFLSNIEQTKFLSDKNNDNDNKLLNTLTIDSENKIEKATNFESSDKIIHSTFIDKNDPKTLASKWIKSFKNDPFSTKKSSDINQNEIKEFTSSWKDKLKKVTHTDII